MVGRGRQIDVCEAKMNWFYAEFQSSQGYIEILASKQRK